MFSMEQCTSHQSVKRSTNGRLYPNCFGFLDFFEIFILLDVCYGKEKKLVIHRVSSNFFCCLLDLIMTLLWISLLPSLPLAFLSFQFTHICLRHQGAYSSLHLMYLFISLNVIKECKIYLKLKLR